MFAEWQRGNVTPADEAAVIQHKHAAAVSDRTIKMKGLLTAYTARTRQYFTPVSTRSRRLFIGYILFFGQ